MRLTDISIKALKPPTKGVVYHYDDTLTGFCVRVSEGGTKSYVLVQGKLRKRHTIGRVGVVSLHDARVAAQKLAAEHILGKTNIASPTWEAARDEYLASCERRLKPRTCDDYRRLLCGHFRFGTLKLSEISPQEIQRRLDKLSDTPCERHHSFVAIKTFFKWAHRRYYVEHHPMDRMQSEFRYKSRERILSDEELLAVWRQAGDDTFGTIVKLLILTGQRPGEVMKFHPSMRSQSDLLTLPPALTKNNRTHTFPVGPVALRLLDRTPFTALPNFARYKEALDEASGVAGWTLHDLRRTLRSKWAELGITREVAEKYINHVSGVHSGVNAIYDRYKYLPEMRGAVERYEAWLHTLLA